MSDTKHITITGKTYKLTLMPAGESRKLWFRMLKVAGPSMSAFLRGGAGGDVAAQAMQELLTNLSEEQFEEFVKTLARFTSLIGADGADYRLDATLGTTAFKGDTVGLIQWFVASLQFQYSDFLALLGFTSSPL